MASGPKVMLSPVGSDVQPFPLRIYIFHSPLHFSRTLRFSYFSYKNSPLPKSTAGCLFSRWPD